MFEVGRYFGNSKGLLTRLAQTEAVMVRHDMGQETTTFMMYVAGQILHICALFCSSYLLLILLKLDGGLTVIGVVGIKGLLPPREGCQPRWPHRESCADVAVLRSVIPTTYTKILRRVRCLAVHARHAILEIWTGQPPRVPIWACR